MMSVSGKEQATESDKDYWDVVNVFADEYAPIRSGMAPLEAVAATAEWANLGAAIGLSLRLALARR